MISRSPWLAFAALAVVAILAIAAVVVIYRPQPAQTRFTAAAVTVASDTDGEPQTLTATLLRPTGDGPFPAVVVLHDCSGRGPHASGAAGRWGRLLANEGYVVIIPDSFAPRGFPDGVCTIPFEAALNRVRPLVRAGDALSALAYLRTLPYVDGKHVGVIGGSHGGTTTLVADAVPVAPNAPRAEERRNGFAAAVALYPGCAGRFGGWSAQRDDPSGPVTNYIGVYHPVAPLLILIGELDDWTPAPPCEALAERAAAAGLPVTVKVYPGAQHAFDNTAPLRYIDDRHNLNKPGGHGATTGGDPKAWADAIEQVKGFFGRYLKATATATP